MKVLVLGGNGFIGSHIVDQLLVAGHQVRVLGRSPECYRKPLKQVEYHLCSFDNEFQVAEALDGMDAVCHLISTTVPASSNLNPIADVESNLINILSLLEQMRKKNIHRLLFLSSGGTVYGNPELSPVSENHPLNPICSYGVVKVSIEKYLNMYQKVYGLQPVILRPSNPYGPRQGNTGVQGLIGTLLARVESSEIFDVWGDGSIVRDYIHVSDLARLCVLALESEACGVFNAGSGKGYSINEMISLIFQVTGKDVEVSYQKERSFDVKEVVLDISAANAEFDWKPKTALADGIADQLQWLKSL